MPYFLFSDASYSPHRRLGVAGIALTSEFASKDFQIETLVFAGTTNTRLELEAILWGFERYMLLPDKTSLTLFTDCKTAVDLISRRIKLEKNGFKSGKTGRLLTNADLYQKFFHLYDQIGPDCIWLAGHSPSKNHDQIQRIFSRVDKKTRQVLRLHLRAC